MRKFYALLAFLFLQISWTIPAHSQAGVSLYCWNPTGSGLSQWVPCNSTTPLEVHGTFSFTPSGTQDVNLTKVGGTAFALGQAAMAASLPVAIASNQSTLTVTGAGGTFPVTIASGGVASGAFSSGSISSGAVASGAFASGSISSGAIAAGAQVDLLTMRGTKAAGTAAANSILVGAIFNTTAPTLTDGQQAAVQVSNRGGLLLGNGYPAGSTPITISATGTTGATTATLATGGSVTTYICGFSIRANATAAATGNATVTGTITGTLNFTQWTAPLASGLGINEQVFIPCIPASAVNTGIAVISAAPGTNGIVSVSAWGYTL